MSKTGEFITVRAVLYLGPLADNIDFLLDKAAKIDDALRPSFTEYILLQAAYKANLFYVHKLEMQALFAPKVQQLFNRIADRIKDDIYSLAVQQLGHGFFRNYEYELGHAQFQFRSLRLTLHRKDTRS